VVVGEGGVEAEVGEAPKKVVARGNPVKTRTKETKGNQILGLVRIDLQTGSHASLWFITFFAFGDLWQRTATITL